MKKIWLFLIPVALLTIVGCTAQGPFTRGAADRLAAPTNMHYREIKTTPYNIATFERVRQKGQDITIYIEGDGVTWHSLQDPTTFIKSANPIALHMATRDLSPNVIYLARPCQYTKTMEGGACNDPKKWDAERFSEEAVNSMNEALTDIKIRYSAKGFNLIGHDGGGAIAVKLTAVRTDVTSLRTVASPLDTDKTQEIETGYYESIVLASDENPATAAASIAHIPQHHFIAEESTLAPASIYRSYKAAAGNSTCIRGSVIKDTRHDEGWVNKWPVLLKEPVDCGNFE